MKYQNLVDEELKKIATKVPYNKAIIAVANVYQKISYHLVRIPDNIKHNRMQLNGYMGKKFNIDVFDPIAIGEQKPCLIYIHGGAFSYRAAKYHKELALIYAQETGCKVFFPDYHLAPKNPFPAAYEDIIILYRWICDNARELQIDVQRIVIAGDSAGAALATSVCNSYEPRNLVKPRAQMLIYPVTDMTLSTESMKKYIDTPLWNARNNKKMWEIYLKNVTEQEKSLASPMQNVLPSDLPPTYIEVTEYDCLHDEGILYAEKLRKHGVSVQINETHATFHGYDSSMKSHIARENIHKRILFITKCISEK